MKNVLKEKYLKNLEGAEQKSKIFNSVFFEENQWETFFYSSKLAFVNAIMRYALTYH